MTKILRFILFFLVVPATLSAGSVFETNSPFRPDASRFYQGLKSRNAMQFELYFAEGLYNIKGDLSDTKSIFSPGFGLKGVYFSNESMQFTLGLAFRQKGYRVKYDLFDAGNNVTQKQDYKNRLNYLSIPLGIRLSSYAVPGVFFEIGPYFDFFLNGTQKGKVELIDGSGALLNKYEIDDKITSTKSLEYGLHLSLFYEIKLIENKRKPSVSLLTGFKYQLGLSSIDGSVAEQNIKNAGTNLFAGFAVYLP